MSNIFLEIAVTVRLEQWSNPTGKAEMVLQVEYDDAVNLEFGNTLQGTIRTALSNLSAALQKEKDDEA